jgi:hypothetical protein
LYDRRVAGWRESLADPVRRRRVEWAVLAVLAWLALLLRWSIDSGGVLDVDVVNFGLAAERFDILDRQPQPPGYPGYVLFLKVLHAVAGGLGPIDVAKWGARICGACTVLAAYWACRELLADREADARGRPLAAAGLAVVHPLLWYYGADGQSHGAEALVTLVLVAVVVRVKPRATTGRLLAVVALFGVAGSLRPTIPLLSSPLLVWLFWRRPLRDWSLAVAVGAVSVAAWAAPTIALSGGWDVYRRAGRALVGDMFVANHSVFSGRAHAELIVANMVRTLWWGAVALLPAFAWSSARGRWARPCVAILAVVAVNLAFYATVYAGEAGYLAAVAALACLVPATWPARPGRALGARIVLTALAGPAFFALGPEAVPVPNVPYAAMPTLAHVVSAGAEQAIYRDAVCGAAGGRRAVLLTDNPSNTNTRPIPLACPNVTVALYVHAMPFEPRRVLDAWMIFHRDGLMAVPTGVPLEPGPPAHVQLPDPVELVILAPDIGDELAQLALQERSCDAAAYVEPASGLRLTVLAARCLPALRTATHSIDFTAPSRPPGDRFGGL